MLWYLSLQLSHGSPSHSDWSLLGLLGYDPVCPLCPSLHTLLFAVPTQRAPSSLRALHLLLSLLSSPVHTWFRPLPPSGHSCMSAHQWCPLDHPQHSPCPFPAIFFSTALITFGHVIYSIVFTCLLFVLPMSSKQPEVRDFCFLF